MMTLSTNHPISPPSKPLFALCEDDKHYNDEALTDNTRLLSAYQITEAVKIWVITEADRSATTLLLPEDY